MPTRTCKQPEIIHNDDTRKQNIFSFCETDSPENTDTENTRQPTNVTLGNILSKFKKMLSLNKARKQARREQPQVDTQLIEETFATNKAIAEKKEKEN